MNKIPRKFKSVVSKAKRLILSNYKSTRAIWLIGSIADGTYNKYSDIDLVWVIPKRGNLDRWIEMEEKMRSNTLKVQIVPFTCRKILWHFKHSTTMAHSIQRGIAVYGKRDRFVLGLLQRNLTLPNKEWMIDWFKHWIKRYQWAMESIRREKRYHKKYCQEKCYCNILDDIARVVVNFSILYLETKGIVPTSKTQIFHNIQKDYPPLPNFAISGIRMALQFSGKDRCLSIEEADKITLSANLLKKKLSRTFKT